MSLRHSSIYVDRIGKRYGRWLVVSRAPNGEKGRVFFNCRCDCGKEASVRGDILHNGGSQSCGCLKHERWIQRMKGNKNNLVHGLYQHPLYKIWTSMKNRCYNSNDRIFQHYGGRGITVCDRWINDFAAFLKDMGERPNTGRRMSLDRINVNGNYESSNCKWSNYSEQRSNQRKVAVLQAEVDALRNTVSDLRKQLKDLKAVAAVPY